MATSRTPPLCFAVALILAFAGNASLLANDDAAAAGASRDWPQWRGPNRNGTSTETGWETDWPAGGPKRLWETRVDRGMSSFAVADGKVYTQGFRSEGTNGTETIYCLDAQTGKELWHYSYEPGLPSSSIAAANTPTLLNGRVYAFGNAADVHCLDAATGKAIWSHNMAREFGAVNVVYGYNASPLVTEGIVVVPLFTGPGQKPKGGGYYPIPGGGLIAFSADTGKELWQNKEGASAWATPTVGLVDGRQTIVTYTGKLLLGINLADGKTLWKDDTVQGQGSLAVAAMPVIVNNKILVPTHVRGLYCVEVQKRRVKTLWFRPKSHWFENIAVWNGCIYSPSREAELDCIDLETGKELWHSTVGMPQPKPGEYVHPDRPGDIGGKQPACSGGTFMIADGKVLMLNRDGVLVCVQVSASEAKVLSTAKILDDTGWTFHNTPTLSHGRIYLRNTNGEVVCLDVSKSVAEASAETPPDSFEPGKREDHAPNAE